MQGLVFAAIIKKIAGLILPGLVPGLVDLAEQFRRGEVSRAELELRMRESINDSFTAIETAHAQSLSSTWASFMDTLKASRLMQAVWGVVTLSQLFVLFWYQWVVPFGTWRDWWERYPSAGATVEWAYLLLAGLLGMGALTLRAGPGKLKAPWG